MQESTSQTETLQCYSNGSSSSSGLDLQQQDQHVPGTGVIPDAVPRQLQARAAGSLPPSPQQLHTIKRQFQQMEGDSGQPADGAAERHTEEQLARPFAKRMADCGRH